MVYVSVTGLRLPSIWRAPRFWRHAIPSMIQARMAPGNLLARARKVDGVQHTLSVWRTRQDMLAYMKSGAHLRAMKVARSIAPSVTCGYESETIPTWDEALAHWRAHGRTY
jgi:hypothetical protein